VRLRVGGRVGGGLLVTSQVDIAYVGLRDGGPPVPEFDEQFVYMSVRGASLTGLTNPTFLRANSVPRPATADVPSGTTLITSHQEQKNPLRQNKRVRAGKTTQKIKVESATAARNALAVILTNSSISRSNTLVLLPAGKTSSSSLRLRMSLDRDSFHALGLQTSSAADASAPHRRSSCSRIGGLARAAVDVPLPAGRRARWALDPERVGHVDVVLSRGTALPSPPDGCVDGNALLHAIVPYERTIYAPAQMCRDADTITRLALCGGVDEDIVLLESLDVAQRLLTGIGISADTAQSEIEEREKVLTRRFIGVCNGDLASSAIQSATQAVLSGSCRYALVGCLGPEDVVRLWAGGGGHDRGDAWPAFGGDAGVVTVVGSDAARAVTFELRAACDL
jgi:hypothetical protein